MAGRGRHLKKEHKLFWECKPWLKVTAHHFYLVFSKWSVSSVKGECPHTSRICHFSLLQKKRYFDFRGYLIAASVARTAIQHQALRTQFRSQDSASSLGMKVLPNNGALTQSKPTLFASNCSYTCQKYFVKSSFLIGWPLIRILSLTCTKWGEL